MVRPSYGPAQQAEFRALAERVVATVERATELGRDEFELQLRVELPPLYAAGVAAYTALADGADEPLPMLTHDHALPAGGDETTNHLELYGRTIGALEEVLGDHDAVRLLLDPYVPGQEPIASSLADAITDLYIDLRQGIALDAAGNAEGARERWFFAFGHWGAHALEALGALHAIGERAQVAANEAPNDAASE